ncbi:hypothetical protein QTN47_21815 [Danxiaibacter flavus]|uniref:Uncharacterized protein n=1 Tax=Danxiaibacter flavus TaxID=3049108 RepID=A0ABV3ZJV6_9BACT|nr:hypothetical protein QNM32_21820 [Chitinophagaceae bacterium DXS]
MSIIIIGGYIIAIIGFPFVFIISLELTTNQRKWLGDDLIYNEWNIGQGPDPSVRLKKVEIYKRVTLFPVMAYLVKTKTYDEWSFPLQRELTVVFSEKDQTLYLTSVVNGYKVFNFSDTIKLKARD